MSDLRSPIRRELGDVTTEEEVQRMWAGIQRQRMRMPVRQRGMVILSAAIVGAAAIIIALVGWNGLRAKDATLGPLRTTEGQPLTHLVGAQTSVVKLSDGSSLDLGSGAELEVLYNSEHEFMSLLSAGRVTFDVRPGGPRRWTIEAGLVTVEVVGTRFEVNRTADAVEVAVTHGVVLVRGEHVPERAKRLAAGERLVVHEPAEPVAVREPRESSTERDVVDPTQAARGARSIDASSRAGARGAVPSIDDLLLQADAKRRSGDLAGAEAILRRILALHAREPRAALAAFTLGKLLFDASPAHAAQAFEQCLALSPPDALGEDALARLIEADARSGASARARAAADEYRRRYPHGRWLDAVKQWADEP
jgi:transmembrane sensor